MKRVAAEKDELVARTPLTVGMAIVRVQPEVVVIALDVEHVEVAVQDAVWYTALRSASWRTLRAESNS